MQPIQDLLNRIRWDSKYAQGVFELEFLDRIEHKLIRLPFSRIRFTQGDHYFFHFWDEDSVEHSVPLHRIKSVYKDGERIWHREH